MWYKRQHSRVYYRPEGKGNSVIYNNNAKLTQTFSVQMVKSGSVVLPGTEMVKGPNACVSLDGQYCSHLVFPPSATWSQHSNIYKTLIIIIIRDKR